MNRPKAPPSAPPRSPPVLRRPDDSPRAGTPQTPAVPQRTPVPRSGAEAAAVVAKPPLAAPVPPRPPNLVAIAKRSLALSDEHLLDECDMSFYVAGGPGGQHRNKTESAVRLYHRPTGIHSGATERRSQHENRIHALARLREKLAVLTFVPKKRKATRATRGSVERRLREKKHSSTKKQNRRDGGD